MKLSLFIQPPFGVIQAAVPGNGGVASQPPPTLSQPALPLTVPQQRTGVLLPSQAVPVAAANDLSAGFR